jgi:hypothetical protein
MVNGKRRSPDFKAQLINRWVYFEIKASSMFSFEKKTLKIEDKVHKGLKSITPDLKFVIKSLRRQQITRCMRFASLTMVRTIKTEEKGRIKRKVYPAD